MREGDILIRYGGEEFLVVLPAASKENAKQIGERLLRSVEDTMIADAGIIIKKTVSIGATSYPEADGENEQSLVKFADEALYFAKESGWNKMIAK